MTYPRRATTPGHRLFVKPGMYESGAEVWWRFGKGVLLSVSVVALWLFIGWKGCEALTTPHSLAGDDGVGADASLRAGAEFTRSPWGLASNLSLSPRFGEQPAVPRLIAWYGLIGAGGALGQALRNSPGAPPFFLPHGAGVGPSAPIGKGVQPFLSSVGGDAGGPF